jgi:hypothetical protein
MIAAIGINLGANRSSWYGWMFLGLAVLIIFPDEALDSIRLTFDWRHLIWLEVVLISIIIVAMIILKRFYPELRWFLPLIAIGFVAVIRGIILFINRSVDDDL